MDKLNKNIAFLKGDFDVEGQESATQAIRAENSEREKEQEGMNAFDSDSGEIAAAVLEQTETTSSEVGDMSSTLIMEKGRPLSKDDEELMRFLEKSMPKIYVVGAGGSGCNTINRMAITGIHGAKIIAMNTDAQHLLKVKAEKKILLGKATTKGLGAGSNPNAGEAAAIESEKDIKEALQGSDLVFITCGMGGGTGTGSAHVIAKCAKEMGALVVGIVTMPFTSEGTKRMENAAIGLDKLRSQADTTIAIPNDKLLFYVPDLPLNAAFRASDMVLTNGVKGITELITKPGLVNLDFADVRTIIGDSGIATIGLGEVTNNNTKDRLMIAADKALHSPLVDVDITQANKALINITGGPGMTLGEAEAAINAISSKISKDAHVIWGATIDESMTGGAVRVLTVLSGIKSDRPSAPATMIDAKQESLEDLEFVS